MEKRKTWLCSLDIALDVAIDAAPIDELVEDLCEVAPADSFSESDLAEVLTCAQTKKHRPCLFPFVCCDLRVGRSRCSGLLILLDRNDLRHALSPRQGSIH